MEQPTTGQPRVISQQVAAAIAAEVRHLVRSGNEALAWERLRPLHPADTGAILMALPRASRDSLLRVMGPESVAWMLRQMNPVQAGRVAARLGSQALSGVLEQVNPRAALGVLLRIHPRHAREVSMALENPVPDTELLAHPSRDCRSSDGARVSLRGSRSPGVRRAGQSPGPGREPARVQPGLRRG